MQQPITIVGAGGHAKVVIATARAAGLVVDRVLDDDWSRWGTTILGVEIAGPTAHALEDPDALVVLAIGCNDLRSRWAASASCRFATLIHPGAAVAPSAALHAGTVVFVGAIVQPDVVVGRHGIVNTGASVDHDCRLGEAVHVAPGARLAGGVHVGDGALVGMGSVTLPGMRIGGWAVVGAGAAVIDHVRDRASVGGVPARELVTR